MSNPIVEVHNLELHDRRDVQFRSISGGRHHDRVGGRPHAAGRQAVKWR